MDNGIGQTMIQGRGPYRKRERKTRDKRQGEQETRDDDEQKGQTKHG